jgi:Flp pilus assembly protein TadD
MVSTRQSKSDKEPDSMAAAGLEQEAGGEPLDDPAIDAKPNAGEVKAPLGFKAVTVFTNIGRTLGRFVDWYGQLTEVKRDDVIERHRKRGIAAFQKGRFADAAKDFAALAELRPTDPWVAYMLGRSLGKAGDVPSALTWLRRAAQLNPGDPEIHFQLGLFLSHEKQLVEAEAEFSKVAKLAPTEAKGHYRLGVVYDNIGEHDKALESLHRALELRPNSPKVNQRLGFVYEGKGDHAQALKYFKHAAEIEDSSL